MKILFIDACVSTHPKSRTRWLCDEYLRRIKNEDDTVERVELEKLPIMPFSEKMLEKRDALIAAGKYNDEMFALARRFKEADKVVIGAPYWDLSFPSVLKVYIEHIMVSGLTFKYTETGAVGLCGAKSLTYITTAGGFIENRNFGFEYIKAVAEMLGIQNNDMVSAQGLDIYGADADKILRGKIAEL